MNDKASTIWRPPSSVWRLAIWQPPSGDGGYDYGDGGYDHGDHLTLVRTPGR